MPDTTNASGGGGSSDNNIDTNTAIASENNLNINLNNDAGEDDEILVTEFPPPPYYYTLASTNQLTPPEIPHRAFRVAAKRVRMEKEKARLESERIRLEAEKKDKDNEGGETDCASKAESCGKEHQKSEQQEVLEEKSQDVVMSTSSSTDKPPSSQQNNDSSTDDNDSITDPYDPNEPIVAVFGEIVEDPTLSSTLDDDEECNNPTILRDNVKRLNHSVLQGFLSLVAKLVHDPIDNKKARDELSHNLFLMLQECNKFREHQAREILIETLERQLERREEGLEVLKGKIRVVDDALDGMRTFEE